jgi:hypothetical protein
VVGGLQLLAKVKVMSDSISGGVQDSIEGAAQRVAGSMHAAADTVAQAACQAHNGVGEVRSVIRAQPITAALVVFALGYLFGRMGALIPSAPRPRHN